MPDRQVYDCAENRIYEKGLSAQVTLRQAVITDLPQFYAISLATGQHGKDASHLYNDPKLMGHIYSAPYLKFSPGLCFVAEDHLGVAGYVVGAANTVEFAQLLEREWWPELRELMPDTSHIKPKDRTPQQARVAMIHQPKTDPPNISQSFPAHIHMNLLPRLQRQGVGTRLLKLWILNAQEQGIKSVHIGVNVSNKPALVFWQKAGFRKITTMGRTVWLGRAVAASSVHRDAQK